MPFEREAHLCPGSGATSPAVLAYSHLFCPQHNHLCCAGQLEDQSTEILQLKYNHISLFFLLYHFCDPAPEAVSSLLSQQLRDKNNRVGAEVTGEERSRSHFLLPATSSHFSVTLDHKKSYLLRQLLKVLEQHSRCFAYDIKRTETFRQTKP